MDACSDCGHNDGNCNVDAETLDEETLARFNEHWQTDGEGCDCPCAIDRPS